MGGGTVLVAADDPAAQRGPILERYAPIGTALPATVRIPCPVCAQGREQRDRYLLTRSRIPREALGARFDTTVSKVTEQALGVAACVALLHNPRGWLTLMGGYGTGKTTLLYATLNHLRDDLQLVGSYWTASELLDDLRQATADGLYDRRFARLLELPVLAIDELEKYRPTDFANEVLAELLNARYRAHRTQITLFACNEFRADTPPPSIPSRMRQFAFVEMGSKDLRPMLKGSGGAWDRGEGE